MFSILENEGIATSHRQACLKAQSRKGCFPWLFVFPLHARKTTFVLLAYMLCCDQSVFFLESYVLLTFTPFIIGDLFVLGPYSPGNRI